MPFGRSVTTALADLIPNDPVMPQVISDAVHELPPNPVKGASPLVDELFPNDPVHPADVGSNISFFIQLLHTPDVGSDFIVF